MRVFRGAVALPVLLVAALVWVAPAQADIPASLKNSCAARTPAPGYSYTFCNDGLPQVGGTVPNQAGTNAVKVPAKYQADANGDNYTGLPPIAPDADTMLGADNQGYVALDVDITIPTIPAPAAGYPLIVFMHGCCGGSPPYIIGADKTDWESTSFEGGRGEQWHYNNAWFASRGYVVINYTARGFVNGSQGSTGETQLNSRRFEMNDFQYLAGLVADDPLFNVDPQRVVTTGHSYGGGFSWLSITDPIWQSPGGKSMKLVATAPKYGWTDLVDSLVPTGRHSIDPGHLPAFDGSDSTTPTGIPKKSIVGTLYENGKGGTLNTQHTTFPPYIDEAIACLNSVDPVETQPLCANTLSTTLPSFISDRSAYYQNQWFERIATDPSYRIPVFSAGALTDPLFPAVEHLRMANRIQSVVPGYPIEQYFGDYMHFVQNKAKEWGDLCGTDHHLCSTSSFQHDYPNGDVNATPSGLFRTGVTTRLNRFIDHYAQPPGNASEPQPAFDVTAALQICPQNASLEGVPADEPGETFTAPRFGSLAPDRLSIDLTGTQTTVNDVEPNPHAANDDPIARFLNNFGQGTCPVDTTPAGPGVAVYDSEPLASTRTMIGATKVSIDYSTTSADGNFQLDSRLYDVFPDDTPQDPTDNTAVMVDRGARRVTGLSGTVTYELHGNGWRFRQGHTIRIEIAQDDDPYLKASNVTSTATITHVKLEIPTRLRCKGAEATIVGTDASETLNGTEGNDVIVGLGGNDRINGLGGKDVICGGDGDDYLNGGGGADVLSGEAGIDTATYGSRTAGVTVSIGNVADDGNSSDGPAGVRDNVLTDVENLVGGSGADTLTGSGADNILDGRNGADVLSGLGGIDTATYELRTAGVTVTLDDAANDGNSSDGNADNVKSDVETLIGGAGADTLTGSAANNKLDGGPGPDLLSGLGGADSATYARRTAGVSVSLDGVANDGNSSDGPAGARDNVLADVERIAGGSGADTLTGNAARNKLDGGPGADVLIALNGNDELYANDGVADAQIDCDGGTNPGTADIAHVDGLDPVPSGCESVGP